MSLCRFCGDAIRLEATTLSDGREVTWWVHTSDGKVVCAIGLDTDQPGELVVHYASPAC